ncbi:calcium-binding protein, partial [Roseibium sediminis]|uniref:calcium-binding protein n=1 Tax=Roseibium sediminis TaxID=1775174 RepID=UPI003CC803C8
TMQNLETSGERFLLNQGAAITADIATNTSADVNIYTGNLNDTITLGAGSDSVWANAGDDVIDAGAGNDTVYGHDGNDRFLHSLGDGNDTYHGGASSSWTDTIELNNDGGDLGVYGVDWTIDITNGAIESVTANEIIFSDDTDGTIVLQDGSTIDFHDMESVQFS